MKAAARGADGAWEGPALPEPDPALPIWSLFDAHARRAPATRWAFACDGSVTLRRSDELRDEALRLAGTFASLGVSRGDAVVAQLPNSREGSLAFLAAMALGAVYVPVVHIYGTAELAFILENSGAKLLVVPARWHNIDFTDRLRRLDRPGLRHLAVDAATATRPMEAPALPAVDPSAACLICYTSGTTAVPKGAMHSHRTLHAEVRQNLDYLSLIDNRDLFVGAPAGHIGPITMMLRQIVHDVNGVYLDRWDAAVAADLIDEFKPGWCVGVPFHLSTLLPFASAGRIRTLKAYQIGGTSVPPALIEQADRAGIVACRSYGSTEHPTIAQDVPTQPLRERAWTDGPLASGSRVRLVDDDGRDVPAGTPGEILSKGPELFLGYFDKALNADAFTADGWFRTGDIGVIDAAGLLTVVDRKKDILIRGGENIAAKEVEDILAHHDAVMEAAVIGWPDVALGERVGAFVKLRPGCTLDLGAVREHFAARGCARQKIPERLVVVDEFPRNPSGKILKTELRARARAQSTAEVE